MTVKTAGQKEGAGLLERATPGPWEVVKGRHTPEIARCGATLARLCAQPVGDIQANAELIALAPDHALLLRAQRNGVRVKYLGSPLVAFSVSFVATGEDFECDEDAAGCPAITPELRSALRKVVGSNG